MQILFTLIGPEIGKICTFEIENVMSITFKNESLPLCSEVTL